MFRDTIQANFHAPERIDVFEYCEINYWTGRFRCSKEQLEDAVHTVGVAADKVEEYLGACWENRPRLPAPCMWI